MDEAERNEVVAPATSWWVRACYTPVSDALRGDLSGRLDARREITCAGLPIPVAELILRVVRKSRLWREERMDVARELIAHFSDGLAAGRTAEQLVADFGDPVRASRLIRQGKLRTRPYWWQAWWYSTRFSLAALAFGILVYVALAARFYWGKPLLAHNYVREINERRAVPDEDRAWPLYREASALMGRVGADYDATTVMPGTPEWDKLVADVRRNRRALDYARSGAEKPHLGAMLGSAGEENPELVSVILDYAQVAREITRLLLADARLAAVEGDTARVVDDVTALTRLADQLWEPPVTLVEQLVSIAILTTAMDVTGRILEDHADIFSEGQLTELAHRFAATSVGESIDFEFERLMFLDLLQRMYTDDGFGEGRVTPEGLRVLDSYTNSPRLKLLNLAKLADGSATASRAIAATAYALGPGMAAMIGSRRENQELYDSLLDEAIRAHQGPPWTWDPQQVQRSCDRLSELTGDQTGMLRYAPVAVMLPSVSACYAATERTIQKRDALEVAIALVLWKKRHGEWPPSLAELVPELLPAVPPDRLDGQPLKYALDDGEPVLYSIGNDRDDDSGRAAKAGAYAPFPISFVRPMGDLPKFYQSDENDGDWILWPPSAQPKEEPPPAY